MPRDQRLEWTAFYWADWLVDAAVNAMNFEQQGRYMRVLARTNQTNAPGVMTEIQVRIWTELDEAAWALQRGVFAACFKVLGSGVWIQQRCVCEAKKAQLRRKRAQKGGRAKASNHRRSVLKQEPSSIQAPSIYSTVQYSTEDYPASSQEMNPPVQKRERAAKPPPPVTEEFLAELRIRYPKLDVDAAYEQYSNHKASDRHKDKRLGLRNWIKKDAANGWNRKEAESGIAAFLKDFECDPKN